MTAAQQTVAAGAAAPKPQKMIGEWFWRFLAVVMVVTVAWVLWIMYQINPQPLITPAGFAAAAKARASQDAKGVITPAAPAGVPAASSAAEGVMQGAASAQAEAPKPNVPAEPKEPPVNPERLKFSDSIETPIPERGKKK